MTIDLKQHPHRRFNPLTGEWVLVSPHRTQRPWQGQLEKSSQTGQPQYDPSCYLCPGNERAGGIRNPKYDSTFVFTNDFAALKPDTPAGTFDNDGVMRAEAERGLCRVICFDPRHDLTVARMSLTALRRVVDVWTEQYVELGGTEWINYVQIFENRGEMMGASNPHPHCQIWSTSSVPDQSRRETDSQKSYHARKGKCLLCEYLQLELAANERLVCRNESFVALVPFWAVWPFEVMVLPRRHITGMDQLTSSERDHLGDIMKRITTRYDNLFMTSFPYSMGFHQRPTVSGVPPGEFDSWHLHAHYYPPLLRSATVRKFMVGFEMLGSPQRDITPESAAERLRDLNEVHFSEQS